MRRDPRARLGSLPLALGLLLTLGPTTIVAAQQPTPAVVARPAAASIELSVEPEAALVVGARGTLRLTARVVPASGWSRAESAPWIVTAVAEGAVLDVVRPRLTRVDALDPTAVDPVLRFPVVARAAGEAVVRVTASTFVCRTRDGARRCRAVGRTVRVNVSVAAPAASPKRSFGAHRERANAFVSRPRGRVV